MNCILSPVNEGSRKLYEHLKLRHMSLIPPRRKSYNVYGYFYNRVSKWLYVIDENLLGGVKTICVTLRYLKRDDQHVLATISIKYLPTSKEKCVYRNTMWEIFYRDRCCVHVCGNMMCFTELTQMLWDVYSTIRDSVALIIIL